MHGELHYGMNGPIIFSAFVLDLLLGDPRWFPHPVRGVGWMVQRIEAVLRRFADTPQTEKRAGVLLVVLVVSAVYFSAYFLTSLALSISLVFGAAIAVLLAYTALATRSLADAARLVLSHLENGDLARARAELSMIVGRDTAQLGEQEIVRAVVETVAENASDGVVAPLFFLAIGGPALGLAYKAVNTLDSMIGYKNQRYINFGWAAARLDDIANFIPARVTAVLICLVSNVYLFFNSTSRTPRIGFKNSWRIMHRDGRNHPSPNSGYPEAALAGALGVRLGGPSTYFGQVSRKPFIGDDGNRLDKKHIEKSILLLYGVSLFAALGAVAANVIP